VFSALGFYPVCPGSGEYAVGSPLVENGVVKLGNGKTLEIRVENQSSENILVRRVEINGRKLFEPVLTHDELMAGGELVFYMGSDLRR
jgi:putative alpha-1,2-mannosidase